MKDRIALVTGGSRGIGRAICLALAARGAKVVACARSGDALAELAAEGRKRELAGEIIPRVLDVTDQSAIDPFVDAVLEDYERIDILVNNAGFLRDKMTFNMSKEEWDAVIDVHLTGTFNCGRWACSYWREQSKAGKIINGRIISTMSHAGLLGNAGQPNYASAKLAIGALTIVWAREMAKYNVTCNAIVPMARTRMTTQTAAVSGMFAAPEGDQFDEMAPDNVSPLVAYLATDHAGGITGRWLSIRGGKLEVWLPPQMGKGIDIGRKWTPKEISERISELGNLGIPGADF